MNAPIPNQENENRRVTNSRDSDKKRKKFPLAIFLAKKFFYSKKLKFELVTQMGVFVTRFFWSIEGCEMRLPFVFSLLRRASGNLSLALSNNFYSTS
jgi:hypothetical protein